MKSNNGIISSLMERTYCTWRLIVASILSFDLLSCTLTKQFKCRLLISLPTPALSSPKTGTSHINEYSIQQRQKYTKWIIGLICGICIQTKTVQPPNTLADRAAESILYSLYLVKVSMVAERVFKNTQVALFYFIGTGKISIHANIEMERWANSINTFNRPMHMYIW